MSKDKKKKKKKAKLEDARFDFKSFQKIWRTFGGHMLRYWHLLAVGLGALVITILTDLAKPWPFGLILDYVLVGKDLPENARWLAWFGSGELQLLLTLCLLIVLIQLLDAIFSFIDKYLMTIVGESMIVDVRERIFVHLQSLSLNFHETSRSGDLIFRMTSDINKVKDLFIDVLQDVGSHSLRFIGIFITMMWMDWELCLVATGVLPVLYLSTHFFSGRVKKHQTEKRERESDVASIVQENMLSISLIQAYVAEEKERDRFQDQNKRSLVAQIKTALYSKLYKRVVQMLIAAGIATVVYVGGRKVVNGDLSPGDLFVFYMYLKELYGPIDKFADMLVKLAQSMVSGERLVEIVEQPVIIKDSPHARPAPAFRGNVEFRNVSFAYKQGRPVLSNLNLKASPGQTVALVGSSGAGKSTMANLLMRFYDPVEGQIRIDDQDIRDYTLASLREQVTVLLQSSFMFRTTIRENIAFACEGVTEERIIAAAKAAQAHDFIMSLPDGYETIIEESGVNFSGGQRQRISIARAILRDAPILILDEPTTGLDALAEAQINQALAKLTEGRTTFVIAHRFSTIMNADHIVLLEEGKISQEGTHEQLLKSSDTYRMLWQLQYGTDLEGRAG